MDARLAAAGIDGLISVSLPALTLAQAKPAQRYDMVDILWIVGGLVIAVVILAGIVMLIRQWARGSEQGTSALGSAGLLDNLRALRGNGQLTEAE